MFVVRFYSEVKLCCFLASGLPTFPGQISCKWIQLVTGRVEKRVGSPEIDDCDFALLTQCIFTTSKGLK